MTTLPVLDIGPYLAGEGGARARLADELRDACENTGFYFMINHGIPQELIDLAFNEAGRFHALPLETKQRLKQSQHYVGYVGHGGTRVAVDDEAERGEEFANRKNRPDLHAAYHINSDFPANHARCTAGERFYIPQPWPDEDDLPGFRENIQTYYAAVYGLGRKLLPVYATALGVPTDYFDPHFEDALAWLRMIHYPRVEHRVENQLGVGAHTDAGFLTFLPQTEVAGLEVQLPSGEWITAPKVPGSYVINAGQMLRRWSNDRWLASPHRVISPDGDRDRYSIPLFFNPGAQATITCIPGADGEAITHEPISYNNFLDWYLANAYKAAANSRVDAA
ncbi:MAG: isopenicillin N synthase family oxygenase [Rhodospirillaceae bacterium]|jgi:isopenicillin N synthase-like dioxygenase|nr:isopenicillin N synthase family oxygenase [Rhodospirillaceae bacterium]MBT3931863.1 isopenicillin N synthase family oxygenase [Rhodospirillaceae bacterium]MBT4772667.1 isopenicillin N synthase family oxygenase [Rhodospirillaceae bacterium]MBT5358155.1 isopenicillin N synthase family oxygenase [Rhodospirillaceae bacterium]MBT5769396.1 isopenicillin N synthase family oxygenase [Rhodospirillaceae bacterium]